MIQPPTPTLAEQFAGKSDADLERMRADTRAELHAHEHSEQRMRAPLSRFLGRIEDEQRRRATEKHDGK